MATKFNKTFSFPLTEEQRAALGMSQAVLIERIDTIARAKKEFVATCHSKTKEMDGQLRGIAKVVRKGAEDRVVECEARKHPKRPIIQLVRLDTGEVFEERPMTDEEKQIRFSEKWAAIEKGIADHFDNGSVAEPEPPAKKKSEPAEPEKPEPTCPVPVPENANTPSGLALCQAPSVEGDPDGFCKWHAPKHPVADKKERKKLMRESAKIREEHEKKNGAVANGSANGHANGHDKSADDEGKKRKRQREDLADDVSRCTDCGEVPCVCDQRAGEEPRAPELPL